MNRTIRRVTFILKEITEDNKLIFLLMTIGLILSDTVMIFFLGNFSAYQNATLSGVQSLKYFGQNNNRLSYNEIQKIDLSEYGVVTCAFSSYVEPEEVHLSDGSPISKGYGLKGKLSINSSTDDCLPMTAYLGNCNLSEYKRENVIVLPCTQYTQSLSYDAESDSYGTVDFFGQTLYIVGISTLVNEAVIPYKLFSSVFEPETVHFYVSDRLEIKKSDALRDKIFSIFGCSNLVDPYSYYRAAERNYTVLILILFIAYLISMLSFVFYMIYFTKRRARSNSISYLCGASQSRLIRETILANEVLSVLCFAAAALVYAVFSSALNLFYSVRFDFKDYAVMLLIVLSATLLCSLPAVRAMKKSTAAELSRNVM